MFQLLRKQYLKVNCQKTQKGSKLYQVRTIINYYVDYSNNHPDTFLLYSRMVGGLCMFLEMLLPLQYYRPLDMLCLIDMLKNLMKFTGILHPLLYVSKLLAGCYRHLTMCKEFHLLKFSFLRLVSLIAIE